MNIKLNLRVMIIRFICCSGMGVRMDTMIYYFKCDSVVEVCCKGAIGWDFSFINVERLIRTVERLGKNNIRGIWMLRDRRGVINNWRSMWCRGYIF